MTEPTETCLYRIDAADAIRFVGPQWIVFARDNEAPELTEELVLERPIWDFVAGAEVRRLYEELFRSLRSRPQEVVIPFRCDSPTVVRRMELTLRSVGSGGIELEGRLLKRENRDRVDILSRRAERSKEVVQVCSLCRRFLSGDAWVEAARLLAQKRIFNTEPVPRLEESVCPTCRSPLSRPPS